MNMTIWEIYGKGITRVFSCMQSTASNITVEELYSNDETVVYSYISIIFSYSFFTFNKIFSFQIKYIQFKIKYSPL